MCITAEEMETSRGVFTFESDWTAWNCDPRTKTKVRHGFMKKGGAREAA